MDTEIHATDFDCQASQSNQSVQMTGVIPRATEDCQQNANIGRIAFPSSSTTTSVDSNHNMHVCMPLPFCDGRKHILSSDKEQQVILAQFQIFGHLSR